MKKCISLARRKRFSVLLVSASDIADITSMSDDNRTPGGIWNSVLILFLRICWCPACSMFRQSNKMWSASSMPLQPWRRHLLDLAILRDLRKRLVLPTSSTTLFHVVIIALWLASFIPWNMCLADGRIPTLKSDASDACVRGKNADNGDITSRHSGRAC